MKITVKRKANAPAADLWNYLADFSNIQKFHPFLKSSHFVDGSDSCEVGSSRQCNFKDGSVFKETIKEWSEGSHYTIKAEDSTGRIKDATASLGVTPIDSETTEVYMTVEMTAANKLMQPMLYIMFKYKVVPAVLKSLEDLYHKDQKAVATLELA